MKWSFFLVWAIALLVIGYEIRQDEFWLLWSMVTISFGAYTMILHRNEYSVRELIVAGLSIRLLLLPAFPLLSDDVYRYLWDGLTWLHGSNPYANTPVELNHLIQRPDLLQSMNSPDYHALYPVVPQGIFASGAWISGGQIMLFTIFIKSCWLFCEAAIVCLLIKNLRLLKKPDYAVGLYLSLIHI